MMEAGLLNQLPVKITLPRSLLCGNFIIVTRSWALVIDTSAHGGEPGGLGLVESSK